MTREHAFSIASIASISLPLDAFKTFGRILECVVLEGAAPDFDRLAILTGKPEKCVKREVAELVAAGWFGRAGVEFRWPS